MGYGNVYKWSIADRLVNTLITTGGNIVLARLLTPADFGLLAMVGIFTAVASNLSSCGMSDWLIKERAPSEMDYSTMFVFNSLLGILFGVIFWVTGPMLAEWFKAPPLTDIMKVIGVCFTLQTMTFVQEARLRKRLDTKTMALVRIFASVCAVGTGIALALTGYGYWGLVANRILLSAFLFVFYLTGSRWFPKLQFSMQSFKAMFSYGVNLLLSYVCFQVGKNISASVLGKISASDSGLYSQGQKMEEVPYQIAETSVTMPFFAVVSNESPDRQKDMIIKMGVNIITLNFGIMCLLMVVAYPMFMLLFGDKWIEAVPIFRLLLIFGFLCNIRNYITTVIKLRSASDKIRNLALVEVCLLLLLLWLAFPYGMVAVVLSQIISGLLIIVPYLLILRQVEKGVVRKILVGSLKSMRGVLIAAIGSAMAHYSMGVGSGVFWDCVLTVFFFALAFVGCAFLIDTPLNQNIRRLVVNVLPKLGK